MNDLLERIIEKDGWFVECESPLEIRNEDGSFVTGPAAEDVLAEYQKQMNKHKR